MLSGFELYPRWVPLNVVVVAPMHASTTRARYEVKYKKSQVNVLTSDKRCKKQWWVP